VVLVGPSRDVVATVQAHHGAPASRGRFGVVLFGPSRVGVATVQARHAAPAGRASLRVVLVGPSRVGVGTVQARHAAPTISANFGVLLWGPPLLAVATVLAQYAAPTALASFAVCGPDGFDGRPGGHAEEEDGAGNKVPPGLPQQGPRTRAFETPLRQRRGAWRCVAPQAHCPLCCAMVRIDTKEGRMQQVTLGLAP
jgi:hypothetical protein